MRPPAPSALPAAEQEPCLDDLLGELRAAEDVLRTLPSDAAGEVAQRLQAAVEALNREAFRRLILRMSDIPAAMTALRQAAEDEVVYAVLRRHELIKPSLQERVETALGSIRPTLASHGGDVELVSVLPPATVEARFLGNCDNCPASVLTFTAGVKRAIREHCPEITEIRQASALLGARADGSGAVHYVSPFAGNRHGVWHEALALDEVPEGGARMVTVAGEPLIFSRQGERVSCFRNACVHLGMRLDGGVIIDGVIVCPHHGFRYDLGTGECLTAPEVQLEPFVVRVVEDRIAVQLGS
jgi:nitrite reductase/ring-hydroxylating ferredoxin subunit/Fe-S cluster biogenesis protein NfuA